MLNEKILKERKNQMKSEYENFEFDNSEFGDGATWIESDCAFTAKSKKKGK